MQRVKLFKNSQTSVWLSLTRRHCLRRFQVFLGEPGNGSVYWVFHKNSPSSTSILPILSGWRILVALAAKKSRRVWKFPRREAKKMEEGQQVSSRPSESDPPVCVRFAASRQSGDGFPGTRSRNKAARVPRGGKLVSWKEEGARARA